jgi:deoxyhypusine synthase
MRGGRFAGVLAADLRPEGLGEILRASVTSEADRVVVVDGAGVTMARSHDATSFVGQFAVDDVRELQNDLDSVSAVFQTETVDGWLCTALCIA